MVLAGEEQVLSIESETYRSQRQAEGVRFSSPAYLASTVVLNFVRWVDMGSPARIKVTIESAEGWDPGRC